MSDSEDSTVIYTEVSSPFEHLSDIGSPGVDGLPMMPEDPYAYVVEAFQAPPSPDYVPGPEEPEQAPPSPEFVLEPVYLEFMPPEDEVFPTEEQPLAAAVSPTTDSPRYIADSDPEDDEEDPKEDPKEDPEEDLTNYPVDGGDDNDDESSDDDEDDDDDDDDDVKEDGDEEDEEEHPALANSILPLVHRLRAKSPSTSYSLPLTSPIVLPHTKAYVAMMRADAPSTYILASRSETPLSWIPPLLPIPLPTPSPPLLLPSTDCRAGVSEVTLPPRMRLCIALGLRYEVSESSSAPTARLTRGDTRMTDFITTVRQDTDEIYGRLDDAQDDRLLMSGQLNMLHRDKRAYAHTARLMETEARLSRKAWVQSMDASDAARFEVRALRTTVLAQQMEMTGLRVADRT
ncbi:hypothetical protein Tco_1334073 [Tanacetum coccineum]